MKTSGVPVVVIVLYVVAAVVAAALWWVFRGRSAQADKPKNSVLKMSLILWSFVIEICMIYVLANEIVNVLKTLGIVLGLSHSILGITVLAWGNSVADLTADVIMAKSGFPTMAIAACFGGPLFNMLIGIGVSLVYQGIMHFPDTYEAELDLLLYFTFGFLIVTLAITLIVVPLRKFKLERNYAWCLLVAYVVFTIAVIVLELVGA
eukprot:TRINITY_DN4614_c0_g2_i1.p1 TRINITY_DN4614_c0_g2~~TRINITY_DN4614_c0_g2_i1.p1  ORF type:complete len:221 (-),score=26.21 TRINITY_DN4614_c0_g2_i1:65-682(-)